MRSRVGLLIACTLGLWAVAFLPARYFGGARGIIYSLVAVGLCLVPSSVTLLWARRRPVAAPHEQMLVVFGGTGLRMIFVLGGGLGLSAVHAYFRETAFWLWLLLFYLFTLTMEVLLLRKGASAATGNVRPADWQ